MIKEITSPENEIIKISNFLENTSFTNPENDHPSITVETLNSVTKLPVTSLKFPKVETGFSYKRIGYGIY